MQPSLSQSLSWCLEDPEAGGVPFGESAPRVVSSHGRPAVLRLRGERHGLRALGAQGPFGGADEGGAAGSQAPQNAD